MNPPPSSFAYLFERFPSFTQTFCYREVLEMRRQGADAPVYSIRKPDDIPQDCPAALASDVRYLPEPTALGREMKSLRMLGKYPLPVIWRIRLGETSDKGPSVGSRLARSPAPRQRNPPRPRPLRRNRGAHRLVDEKILWHHI